MMSDHPHCSNLSVICTRHHGIDAIACTRCGRTLPNLLIFQLPLTMLCPINLPHTGLVNRDTQKSCIPVARLYTSSPIVSDRVDNSPFGAADM